MRWTIEARGKLCALSKLKDNWDSYGGKPLSIKCQFLCEDALDILETYDLPVPAIVLCSSGNVQLEWEVDGRELEIEFGEDYLEYYAEAAGTHFYELRCDQSIFSKKLLCNLASWLAGERNFHRFDS